MINKTLKIVVTFFTTSEAMALEKACKEMNVAGALVSAPRELTSDCGIAYKTELDNKDRIVEILKSKGIEYDKISELYMY